MDSALNLVYDEWPNFLGNRPMVDALLSRLRHYYDTGPVFTEHSVHMHRGRSYAYVRGEQLGRCLLAIIDTVQDATNLVARALRTDWVFQHRLETRTGQSGR